MTAPLVKGFGPTVVLRIVFDDDKAPLTRTIGEEAAKKFVQAFLEGRVSMIGEMVPSGGGIGAWACRMDTIRWMDICYLEEPQQPPQQSFGGRLPPNSSGWPN